METVKRSMVARGWGKRVMSRQRIRIFRAVKLFCIILTYGYMSLHICQNAQNVQHQERNFKVNYGLRVIMICQGMFISCEKCNTVDVVTLCRRQGSRPSPWKRNAKSKMAVWGGLINSCEEKRGKKQRRKGKI